MDGETVHEADSVLNQWFSRLNLACEDSALIFTGKINGGFWEPS
jgi:hypothetical protein